MSIGNMFAPSFKDLGQESAQPCFDPECAAEGGIGEPEQDGEHRYFTCTVCGNDFGWYRVQTTTMQIDANGDTCAIGVPQEVRLAASKPMETALEDAARAEGKTRISIGMRPGA